MYGQHPWYSSFPSNGSYNPYLHSSYQSPRHGYPYEFDEDRARALAEQRARRAQYLPDEVDDDDYDDWGFNQLGPRERAYLEAKRRQEMMERRKQEEEARQRALEEQRWQKALEERQREDEEVRQRLLEERRRQLRLKREEEERRKAADREKKRQQQGMHRQRDRSQSNASERRAHTPAQQEARDSQQQQGKHGRRDRSRSNARPQSPAHQDATSIPIHIHRDSQSTSTSPSSPLKTSIPATEPEASPTRTEGSSRPSTPRTSPARTPSPISRHSLEEQNEAASRIQKRFRIHSSLRSLDNLATEFGTLRKNFVYPRTIDFQKPGSEGGHISVGAYRPPSDFDNEENIHPMDVDGSEGKLDYTSINYALNSYTDSLDKLLMKLDGVESWGQKEIRSKRRTIVKSIEKEASKVERYWKQAWVDYLAKQASNSKPSNEDERANFSIPITVTSLSESEPPASSEEFMEDMED